jgi:hypothetical protein
MSDQIQTRIKKPGRGMGEASISLIAAMHTIAAAAHPITGRGVGYLHSRGARLGDLIKRPNAALTTTRGFISSDGGPCTKRGQS